MPTPRSTFARITATVTLGLLAPLAAQADANAAEGPGPVVPYRPSLSTPAQLPAPGYLEVEAGGLQARAAGGPERRDSLPLTLKLAFSPDWGLMLGTEAWARSTDASGAHLSGGGDLSLTLKRRFAVDDASAFGLELSTTRPTAPAGLGNGAAQWGLNGIYSRDFAGDWHTDLNLSAQHQSAASGQPASWQQGGAAALSRSLGADWGVVGELSATHDAGAKPASQALLAGSWNASNDLVLDAGLARGLSDAAPRWQLFAGFTLRAGRVF